jgi:hypothetical protein
MADPATIPLPLQPYNPFPLPSGTQFLLQKQQIIDKTVDRNSLAKSYSSNSAKELTLLEYCEDFRRQFIQLYPTRRPLLLTPKNECGVRKFICSAIKPHQLPFTNIYNYAELAEFVSDYITYLPLDNPVRLPDYIPSYTSVLKCRYGDCIDMSNLLCSLLRGNNYNCYVCIGTAPNYITQNNQTQIECPQLVEEEKQRLEKEAATAAQAAAELASQTKYILQTKPQFKSKYVAAREQDKIQQQLKKVVQEEHKEKLDELVVDSLQKQRAHAWILIINNRRDLTHNIYIDPVTATVYPVNNSPFLSLDGIYNEESYYINLQTNSENNLSNINFDLNDNNSWEYLLIDETKVEKLSTAKADFEQVNQHSEATKKAISPEFSFDSKLKVLDAGQSYIENKLILIDRESFTDRYPVGEKRILYKNSKIEKFSPYNNSLLGLIQRLTVYQPAKLTKESKENNNYRTENITEIREKYAHRKDGLVEKRIYPKLNKLLYSFAPGHHYGLRNYITIATNMYNPHTIHTREFSFYPASRVDSLVKRIELVGNKVVEEYDNRDDCLIFRSIAVELEPPTVANQYYNDFKHKPFQIKLGSAGDLTIRKITEKFRRNPKKAAENDVKKRSHLLNEGLIRLDYHYGDEFITNSRHIIDKQDKLELAETEGPAANSNGLLLRVNAEWNEKGRGEEQQFVAKLLQIEKELKVKVRDRENLMSDLVITLQLLDQNVELVKDVYQAAYEHSKKPLQSLESISKANETAAFNTSAASIDYLTPFLSNYPANRPLTRRQALMVKEECLSSLKERLLERANIIQQHLDEEQSRLHARQAMFKRQAGTGSLEASEEFNQFSEECLFRIDILNARRARHEELALKKYVEMDEKLNNDPRLAVLHQPE